MLLNHNFGLQYMIYFNNTIFIKNLLMTYDNYDIMIYEIYLNK